MKTYSIAHLKSHLSEAIRLVKSGQEIMVSDHNQLVAKMVSLKPENLILPEIRLSELLSLPLAELSSPKTSNAELIRKIRDEDDEE